MERVKKVFIFENYIIFFLFTYILLYNPFITDVFVPKIIRFLPPLLFFGASFIILFFKDRRYLKLIVVITSILILIVVFWMLQNTLVTSNAILVVSSILFILFLYPLFDKKLINSNTVIKYWNYLIWISIIMTILSYIFFNLFNEFTFINKALGSYAEFNSYFSPLFGVVSVRTILQFKLGRVSWLFSEPSYLGFFHGLNFFWFQYLKKYRNYSLGNWGKYLSILALFCSISLGSWLSFLVAFLITAVFRFFFVRKKNKFITLSKFRKNISIFFLLICATFLLMNQLKNVGEFIQDYYENIDKYSSLDDRSNRIENSSNLLNSSNIFQIFFGRGPGSIESIYSVGESNGWIKSLIEQGFLLTIIYFLTLLMFFVYNKDSLFLVSFVAISYNSVILMFSPLAVFYLFIMYFITKNKIIS